MPSQGEVSSESRFHSKSRTVPPAQPRAATERVKLGEAFRLHFMFAVQFRLSQDVNGPANHAEGRAVLWPHRGDLDRSGPVAPHGSHRIVAEALPHRLPQTPQPLNNATKALVLGHPATTPRVSCGPAVMLSFGGNATSGSKPTRQRR